jgi:hypothetical protein
MTSDTLKATTKYEVWLGVGNMLGSKIYMLKFNAIKHCIVLYDLPHFEVCITFHNFYQVWTLVLANSPCQEGPLNYG